MKMDDSAPTHERTKLVKTYRNMLPRKRIVVAKVCGETYLKMTERWSRKTATNLKNEPYKLKGNAEKERENSLSFSAFPFNL